MSGFKDECAINRALRRGRPSSERDPASNYLMHTVRVWTVIGAITLQDESSRIQACHERVSVQLWSYDVEGKVSKAATPVNGKGDKMSQIYHRWSQARAYNGVYQLVNEFIGRCEFGTGMRQEVALTPDDDDISEHV